MISSLEIIVLLCVVTLIALNIYATHRCLRDALATPTQRKAQLFFIWLIPILGAVLVLAVTRNLPEQGEGVYGKEIDIGDKLVTGCGRLNERGYVSSPDDNFHISRGDNTTPDSIND